MAFASRSALGNERSSSSSWPDFLSVIHRLLVSKLPKFVLSSKRFDVIVTPCDSWTFLNYATKLERPECMSISSRSRYDAVERTRCHLWWVLLPFFSSSRIEVTIKNVLRNEFLKNARRKHRVWGTTESGQIENGALLVLYISIRN